MARKKPSMLFISTGLPWPLDCGHNIRVFENLVALSNLFEVTFISMIEAKDVSKDLVALNERLPEVIFVEPVFHPIHIGNRPLLLARVFLKSLVWKLPYKAAKFVSKSMIKAIEEQIAGKSFDVVYFNLGSAYCMRRLRRLSTKNFLCVLEEMDVIFEMIKQYSNNQELGLRKLISHLESIRTEKYEVSLWEEADAVFTISEEDRKEIANYLGEASKVFTIPACINNNHVKRDSSIIENRKITFVGPLTWPPNAEGIQWFADQVLPLLRIRNPDVEVQVVGSGITPSLQKYFSRRKIEALGYVQDLSETYENTSVFIAPFLTAGGVRLKILDAMLAGLPIVATQIACRGLGVTNRKQVLIANNAQDFADAVNLLIEDVELRRHLVVSSLYYVTRNHSRQAVLSKMESAFTELQVQSDTLKIPLA